MSSTPNTHSQTIYRISLLATQDGRRVVVVQPPLEHEAFNNVGIINLVSMQKGLGVTSLNPINLPDSTQYIFDWQHPTTTPAQRNEIVKRFGNDLYKLLRKMDVIVSYNANIIVPKLTEDRAEDIVKAGLKIYAEQLSNPGSTEHACVFLGMPELMNEDNATDPAMKTHGLTNATVSRLAKKVCNRCKLNANCKFRAT